MSDDHWTSSKKRKKRSNAQIWELWKSDHHQLFLHPFKHHSREVRASFVQFISNSFEFKRVHHFYFSFVLKFSASCIFVFFLSFFGGKKLEIKTHPSPKVDIVGFGEPVKPTGLMVKSKNNRCINCSWWFRKSNWVCLWSRIKQTHCNQKDYSGIPKDLLKSGHRYGIAPNHYKFDHIMLCLLVLAWLIFISYLTLS